MSIIAFQPKPDRESCGWTAAERCQLEALFDSSGHEGEVSERVFQVTEHGDPQFFLLGPAPDHACVLSIARVGGRYMVENGDGALLGEAANLEELRQVTTRVRLGRRTTGLIAQFVVAWTAFRNSVEERTEPLIGELVEVTELLSGVAPHLAAFA